MNAPAFIRPVNDHITSRIAQKVKQQNWFVWNKQGKDEQEQITNAIGGSQRPSTTGYRSMIKQAHLIKNASNNLIHNFNAADHKMAE